MGRIWPAFRPQPCTAQQPPPLKNKTPKFHLETFFKNKQKNDSFVDFRAASLPVGGEFVVSGARCQVPGSVWVRRRSKAIGSTSALTSWSWKRGISRGHKGSTRYGVFELRPTVESTGGKWQATVQIVSVCAANTYLCLLSSTTTDVRYRTAVDVLYKVPISLPATHMRFRRMIQYS